VAQHGSDDRLQPRAQENLASLLHAGKLWAGNTESLRKAFFSRDSILLWSLTTHGKNVAKYTRLRQDPAFAHLRWHEVRSARDAQRLLQSVRLAGPSSS
jgi:hypothetical protein